MANNALKSLLKTDLIDLIRSSISNSNNYYLFVGRSTPYEDNASTTSVVESDTNPPSIAESSRNQYDSFRNMIFAKRIQPENMRFVIPRIDWTSGSVYTPYTETTDMAGKSFYVITSDFNVYKCMGAVGSSTIMPTGKSSDVITLSDGYKWKYLYTVSEDDIEYITLEYIPIFVSFGEYLEQREVQNTAKPGSIDSVSMTASLSPTFSKIFKYDRAISDLYKTTIRNDIGITANIAGSSYIHFVPVAEDGEMTNGYYNNYSIYITSGPGFGQYFRILNFIKGGSGVSYYYANVYPTLNREITNQSTFKIIPNVVVDGDGENAIVIPVTTVDKKISSLSVINPGKNYTYAKPRVTTESGSVSIGSQVTLLNNSVSVNLSTPKGHGYNAVKELGASNVMMVVELEGTEENKLSVRNEYRQFGLLKNPYLYGGLTLAGADEDKIVEALIKRPPYKDELYFTDTFVAGNHIVGKETKATARIVDSQQIAGTKFHKLFLTDLVGDFRLSQDASTKIRIHYTSGFSAAFATGDTANQYVGTVGLTLSASGVITTYDHYDRSVVIDTTFGSFVSGKTLTFSGGYTLSGANITDLDEEFGEQLGQINFGTTSGTVGLTFGEDEVFGRLASTGFSSKLVSNLGEYRLTTRMTLVNSSAFTDGLIAGSNALDGTLSQTDSTTLKKVTADIVDFTVAGGVGFTGIAHVSNVTGTFNLSDQLTFTPYGTTADAALTTVSINSISNPELDIGSGDLLYIENIRPVQRNIEQMEQFKILIGF